MLIFEEGGKPEYWVKTLLSPLLIVTLSTKQRNINFNSNLNYKYIEQYYVCIEVVVNLFLSVGYTSL